ncbi:MAG: heme ABC transporter permease [Lysobacterales bacterium]|nr:MAG: heme ABC transporter permease [Xanthomonadales bacterium]
MKHWLASFHRLASPPIFFRLAGRIMPWSLALAILSGGIGLVWGLVYAPADYLQGESVRILYIHVPAAWMSLAIWAFMAFAAIAALVWRTKVAETLAMAAAPIGACFTAITLLTGSLWGRPTWGTYWVWDARLTSELILLFLYLGVIGLYRTIEDPRRAARAASVLILVGLVNLPIIRYSVEWWSTLHQPASIRLSGSSIHPQMLWPLLVMALATKFYFLWAVLARARMMLAENESNKQWVRDLWREGRL